MAPLIHGPNQPGAGMTAEYDGRAETIADGHGVMVPDNLKPSDTDFLAYPPGYSIFLASIYHQVGRDYFAVQLFQNVLNSLSSVLIFLIAAQLVSWSASIASGLLSAVSHHLAYYSNFILPDGLCALPLLVSVYLLVKAERSASRSLWLCAAAGLTLGLSVWLRPNSLLLGPFLIIVMALISLRRGRSVKNAAVMALVSLVVVAPITIRNYVVYREFIPVTIHLGVVLWEGIGESSGDRFGAVSTDDEVAQQDAILYGDERYAGSWASPDGIRRDRDHVGKSIAIIIRHPFWYGGVMLKRMGELVKYSAQAPLVDRGDDAKVSENGNTTREVTTVGDLSLAVGKTLHWTRAFARALQRVAKETALVFIIAGAIIMFSVSWRKALLVAAVPTYYLLAQSAMHVEFRYALPMHYFLFLFAGITWVVISAAAFDWMRKLGRLFVARAPGN